MGHLFVHIEGFALSAKFNLTDLECKSKIYQRSEMVLYNLAPLVRF